MTTDALVAPSDRSGPLLRTVLFADAAACGAAGGALLFAPGAAAVLFGAPEPALAAVGGLLLLMGAGLLWLARRPAVPAGIVRVLIALDLLWAVDTVGIVALGWIRPTTTGLVLVLVQAVAVLAVAGLKAKALRRVG